MSVLRELMTGYSFQEAEMVWQGVAILVAACLLGH